MPETDKIFLQPTCYYCGYILYIQDDGIMDHPTVDICVNSMKRYRFQVTDPQEGEYSKEEMLDRYKSISIVEIK